MKLLLPLLFVFSACHAKVETTTAGKMDHIMPAVNSLMGGTPDDFSDADNEAFDQFIADVVKGNLMTIDEELAKLKRRSSKAFDTLRPLAVYFKNGYEKLKSPEGRKFFVDELPAVSHTGVGITSMISIAYNFYQLPDSATDEIYKAFPEVME